MYKVKCSYNGKQWFVWEDSCIVKVFYSRKAAINWVNANASLFGEENE